MKATSYFRQNVVKTWLDRFGFVQDLPGTALWLLLVGILTGCGPDRIYTFTSPDAGGTTGSSTITNTASPTVESRTTPVTLPATEPKKQPVPSSGWNQLFDGSSLKGWKLTEFGGHGEVAIDDSQIVIHLGAMLTGVSWTNEFPKSDYEVELEARKLEGGDFFAGITFPVGDSFCSFIVGGWGGGVVGLSSIDGMDASENETTRYMSFPKDRWFRLKLRVTREKIQTWIDDEQMADVALAGRRISLRSGDIYLSQPFGIATWQTTGAIRNIRLHHLGAAPAKPAQ